MFRKNILHNGLKIITQELEGTKAVTVLILVGAGSRYEHQEIRGISHFLEHMFFKGAKKYQNTKEVSEAIDSVGGTFNAFTGKEYAGYYVKVASENIDVALNVLSDMLINPTFAQEEIEKERGVILEEYNMYQDTPMYQIGWNFEQLIFGDQPLGWDQIGTKELIKSVNHQDFVDYYKKLYTPDNTVIAIVGNVDHDQILEKATSYFDMKSEEKSLDFKPLKELPTERLYLKEKKTEQAHVAVGFPGYPESHPKHWALKLLAIILGGNMSSRMFLGVREAKGLAYYIRTSTDNYSDGGAIVTNAGVDLNRIEDAIEGIINEYKNIRDNGLEKDELKKAKAYLKGKLVLGLEDSEEFAHMLAKYELLRGEAKTPNQIFELIEKVTEKEIMEVAQDIIKEKETRIAVIGPYKDESKFTKFLG